MEYTYYIYNYHSDIKTVSKSYVCHNELHMSETDLCVIPDLFKKLFTLFDLSDDDNHMVKSCTKSYVVNSNRY